MAINPDFIKTMDRPYYTPGVDIYDRDAEGPVLQLGVTLTRFTGDLYMKLGHFHYIATQKLNYLPPTEAEELKEMLETARGEIKVLREELVRKEVEAQNGFNDRLEHFLSNFNTGSSANDRSLPVADDSADAESAPKKSNRKAKDISVDEL